MLIRSLVISTTEETCSGYDAFEMHLGYPDRDNQQESLYLSLKFRENQRARQKDLGFTHISAVTKFQAIGTVTQHK